MVARSGTGAAGATVRSGPSGSRGQKTSGPREAGTCSAADAEVICAANSEFICATDADVYNATKSDINFAVDSAIAGAGKCVSIACAATQWQNPQTSTET
eukprot:GHVO01037356.1.p3 GENE.GHVO01037356.1~~GHVO01037356.1.p3  ORF type:complete len:100 (+),score=15.11 GHVO01037356.1:602-901(+)